MSDPDSAGGRWRYDEFEVGSTTIAMVQSTIDERAWVQSTHSVPVTQ